MNVLELGQVCYELLAVSSKATINTSFSCGCTCYLRFVLYNSCFMKVSDFCNSNRNIQSHI